MGALGQDDPPLISALVCTCSRNRSVVDTVSSILANTHPHFELVVIDQSKDRDTEEALEPFKADPRLTYLKIKTTGKGYALNAGVKQTRGKIIAITDDDCMVPANWLETFASIFESHARVGIAFCCVEAAEHDQRMGFIPDYVRPGERTLTSLHDARFVQGLGAGIAVRRDVVDYVGGFDTLLGPGSRFPSCDDRDIAIRGLLAGYHVYETSRIAVRHFGFRTWKEGRQLAHRDFLAIGGAYSKFFRSGRAELMYLPFYEFAKYALWPPIRDVLHLRQPSGLVRISAFLTGFLRGLRTPVDRKTMRFVEGGE